MMYEALICEALSMALWLREPGKLARLRRASHGSWVSSPTVAIRITV